MTAILSGLVGYMGKDVILTGDELQGLMANPLLETSDQGGNPCALMTSWIATTYIMLFVTSPKM